MQMLLKTRKTSREVTKAKEHAVTIPSSTIDRGQVCSKFWIGQLEQQNEQNFKKISTN